MKPWDINNPCAQKITKKKGEMIALDNRPFSLVGLIQHLEPRYSILSRKYITEVVIPRIVDGVTAELHKQLGKAAWLSFTTDIWSTYVSSDCLLSLTVHWLTDSLERKSAVLHAEPLHGSHTGEVLCGHYHRMLAKWNISES